MFQSENKNLQVLVTIENYYLHLICKRVVIVTGIFLYMYNVCVHGVRTCKHKNNFFLCPPNEMSFQDIFATDVDQNMHSFHPLR